MADADSVSPGLATLGAGGWTVTEPSAGGRFGSVGVLTPQQVLAIQALVSGAGGWGWGGGARRQSFIVKPQGGLLSATASPDTLTYVQVLSSPVPFFAVRLHVQHYGAGGSIGPMTGFRALLGASDDIGSLDFTNVTTAAFKKCVAPQRAGTEYINAVTDGSPGWKAVTWAGATSVNIADPGAGKVAFASSDVIYETGVLDLARGVYPLLVRYQYGSAGYSYVTNLTGQQIGTNWVTDFPTRPQAVISRSGDCITTPSVWTSGNTPNLSSSGANMFVEFFTASGVVSVHVVGDSRFSNSSEFSGSKTYLSTEMYLHNAISALGYNPAVIRGACNGAGALKDNLTSVTQNVWVNAVGVQSLPQPANWLVYLVYSVNDGVPSDGLFALLIGRAVEMAAAARRSGQRVLMVTAFPRDGGFSGADLGRLAALSAAAGSLADATISPLNLYGDATGAWANYRFDSSHMTDAGYSDLAARIAAVVTT